MPPAHVPVAATGSASGQPSRLRSWWLAQDPELKRKATGLFLAIAVELLLILALFSFGIVNRDPVPMRDSLVTVTMSEDTEKAEESPPETPPEPAVAAAPREVAEIVPPEPEQAEPVPRPRPTPALIPISPNAMRSFDIARVPPARPAPAAPQMGPANAPRPGDSERIAGSGPNGEPLYAARWYREPRDDELRGYLSTASGPGWALINCRTAPQFRVEDCVLVAEAPQGSNMGRAVLAAAWQFKVRPPQIGGRPQVGEWVRIRIDYTLQPAVPAYSR